MTVKPISPEDIPEAKLAEIPEEVFVVFNRLIARNYDSGVATVYRSDVIDCLIQKPGFDSKTIFANKWLNVEDAYRAVGWKVSYDKPGFNESYRAYFTFEKDKKK